MKMMNYNKRSVAMFSVVSINADSIFNFFECVPSFCIIYFLVIMGFKEVNSNNQSFMIILFSSVADSGSNNISGNGQPPEWLILLSGIFITICVGYCMQKVITNTLDSFYSNKKTEGDQLEPDQIDQLEPDQIDHENETEDEISEKILLAEKKLRDEEFARQVLYEIHRFKNGGRRPY